MSLVKVPKAKLVEFADAHDVDSDMNKKKLMEELESIGLNWEEFVKWENRQRSNEVVEEPKEEVSDLTEESKPQRAEEKVMIKMSRANPVFEYDGVRFTQNEPYQLMNAESASRLLENEQGFSRVSREDAQEVFKK